MCENLANGLAGLWFRFKELLQKYFFQTQSTTKKEVEVDDSKMQKNLQVNVYFIKYNSF